MPPRTTRNSQGLRTAVVTPRRTRRAIAPVAAEARRATTSTTDDEKCPSKKIQWLKCRDQYGVPVIVKYSDTGEGIHMVWDWSGIDEDPASDADDTMDTDPGTPPPSTAGESIHTPQQRHPYDAGSILRTPVKRAKRLQPSPTRFGDKGVHCFHEYPGLHVGNNGDYRMILNHEVGSSVNLSREDVEQLRAIEDEKIFLVQLKKLMDERSAMGLGGGAWEEDATMDEPSPKRRVQTAGPEGTILLSGEPVHQPNHGKVHADTRGPLSNYKTGSNGELRDRRGRPVLGPEGTIFIDPTFCPVKRPDLHVPVVAKEDGDEDMEDGGNDQTPLSDARHYVNAMPIRCGPHPPPKALGPEPTELVIH